MVTERDQQTEGGPITADGAGTRFFEEIARSGLLPLHASAYDAASAVLCTLSQRVTGGEAREFVSCLSPSVQALLAPCVLHRDEPAQDFDRAGYLSMVADHLRCSLEEAEQISREVFTALQGFMPEAEIEALERELPPDLRPLWRAH
jgi:uncharacterized protein (DUF2267 family)